VDINQRKTLAWESLAVESTVKSKPAIL
jgi:hypothetical protein